MLWLCVIVRVIANPVSNVLQKSLTQCGAEPLCVVCVTHALLSVACVPIFLSGLPPLSVEFWYNMAISTAVGVAGNVLIVQALKRSDLSVLGPLNSYKPVVSLVPGTLLLHEYPDVLALAGIALVVAGSYGLIDSGRRADGTQPDRVPGWSRFLADRGVQFRLAALILSATEAVFLKRAQLVSTPFVAFAFWSALGFVVLLCVCMALLDKELLRRQASTIRQLAPVFLLLFATTGLMQLSTLIVFSSFQVGAALALFQTSTLLSVVLGHRFFQEGQLARRLAGAAVMALGALLIVLER